jgi:hypothetical protein
VDLCAYAVLQQFLVTSRTRRIATDHRLIVQCPWRSVFEAPWREPVSLYAGRSPIAVLNSIWSDVGSPSGREARFEADASDAVKWSHAADAYTGVEDTPVLR